MPGGILQSLATHSAQLMARATPVCDSQVCQTAAASILNDLDLNVDPCSDFYQYTCGGWVKNHAIPASQAGIGGFINLHYDNLDSLQKLLEGSYDDVLVGIRNDSGLLNDTQKEQDRANFNKLKAYYGSCMNEAVIDAFGPTPIYPYLSKIATVLGSSSAINNTQFGFDHLNRLTDGMIESMTQGSSSLVKFTVGPDDRHPDQYALFLSQPDLTLSAKEYYNQSDVMDQYRSGLITLITNILGESNETDKNMRLEKMRENNLPVLRSADIESMVDGFVKFEVHLASITVNQNELQDPVALYNPMSIAELNQKYPIVNWARIFHKFASNTTSLPDHVVVNMPKYMEQLTDWFLDSQTGNVSTQAIREFFTIKSILRNVDYLDKTTRNIYQTSIDKIVSGMTEAEPRSRDCTESTSVAFGQLLGRYFVLKSFGGEPQRKQVSEFIDRILSAWTDRLEKNVWLDDETRSRAIEKVKMIVHQQAYGTAIPDVRSPTSLHDYYADIQVNNKSYFGNGMASIQSIIKKDWNKIGKKVNKNEWQMTPHEVNAYYTPNYNEVVIPAGILQSPFYNTELPDYLNYGGIGSVIGHEITHAFDNQGRLYDGHGVLNTWWTNTTSAAFEDKSQCFIRQYSNFSIDGPDHKQYHVDGNMTIGENLADNGGVSAAYQAAFSKNASEQTILPGLEKFSAQQLFFISYGRIWCSSMRPEKAVQRIRSDVHSPDNIRTNAVVQNSAEFAKAFKCPERRPMNPLEKCQIW
ncbi:hypothetical protein G6F62_000566 [Rhizopus arrhizus]|nr:hypothetical protein G6F23_001243 [Rhizopus arrhizus]KAG0768258.1 hypothetical protein G6F24_002092 [Rhizopus arrhizus]KAG0786986.1 hypothetical protein G6F22_007463 [Rhizopus arrhizus]KAG0793684.1 hypothetical protein G6F21_003432 [Rhizopus arrhizus]KAG0814822.1 hypothetical protein G6F20_004472 [Rhizopus arrhizus]